MVSKVRFISFLFLILLVSCNGQDSGQFEFFSKEKAIVINNYTIYVDRLDNLLLIINNDKERELVLNSEIDSLKYVGNSCTYTATRCKISGEIVNSFHYITQNDKLKIFPFGKSKNGKEIISIGLKDSLKCIVKHNVVDQLK
ncbi:hypothetical protein NHF50_01045 [Flavobacterium sp. NRK F10]|uniref:hypothetical protein n=1 Tax=Flavobacterium sp. NRK F10 TaxID=2954931 RepID=UPI0020916939|nr:hypothetical protein [Flavobacterium sp. NRK F10]MCO6173622.1 hypothetical protein [Flavobacterium sp. NRK F10]